MFTHSDFLNLIDQYKLAADIESDGALSARMFNDGKKIAALRTGKDITLGRLISGIDWLRENWPDGKSLPDELRESELPEDAA